MGLKAACVQWNELTPVVSYANLYTGDPGGSFGPRYIADYQFILVVSGKGQAVIQSAAYEAKPGDLFYYGPHVVHTFTADPQDPFILYGIHFSWQAPLPARGGVKAISVIEVDSDESPVPIPNTMMIKSDKEEDSLMLGDKQSLHLDRIEPRFARIVELYRMDYDYIPLLLRSLFLELIISIKQGEQLPHLGRATGSPIVRLVAEKLHRHAEDKYDRGWLETWTSYHPDYISRVFRRETGLTPYDYFMKEKLALAKHALIHSDEPLARLADRLSAASIHAFTKWFKEHTGLPPGKYRQWSRMI
ncbi:helix-turn-helix domain-containing protein [Paenibacillus sepulcri]|uniref:AraC family transcriptional regulator n=1 Tax=Paenibacillus sepulcri TaxID=359917 RepID=A0ABS7CC66_9BACL|nr:AraC family transcriptional regulator [Paenibacillus sepulcri]